MARLGSPPLCETARASYGNIATISDKPLINTTATKSEYQNEDAHFGLALIICGYRDDFCYRISLLILYLLPLPDFRRIPKSAS